MRYDRYLWVLFMIPLTIRTQPSDSGVDSLQCRLNRIQCRLEQLEKEQREAQKKDAIQKLFDQAQNLSQKKKEGQELKSFHSGLRQQSILNPNISIGCDFYYSAEKSENNGQHDSEYSSNKNKFTLKEIEIGIESYLDPYSRGKVFIGVGHEGAELEEGYGEWMNCPLNMNLKIGQFKAQFGQLNRYHDHALPQFDRPLVLAEFFGECSLKGAGIGGNFLLPRLWAHVNELDIELITVHEQPLFTDEGKTNAVIVTHLKNYYDLNRSTYFELGLSCALGKNDPKEKYQTIIGGMDLTLKWIPPDRSKYSGVEWRTEALLASQSGPGDPADIRGMYSSLQIRLGARLLISGRVDYTELPYAADSFEKGGTLALDYWQSEFVFFRFQVSSVKNQTKENDYRFIIQTNWAMGPHKHEAY